MNIKVEGLEYTYMPGTPYEKTAVHDVELSLSQGEFVGIIGHTGSGKSTLIQHLNGLLKPTSGRILVDGIDIADKDVKLRELRFKVGIVFQYPEYQLFDETVKKDISFGPHNMGLSEAEIEERVREAMELVGLDPVLAEKSPFELSGGQKRRVAIAGVLAMQPEILILDEPAAGLDPHGRNEILNQIGFMHREKNMTIVLVSHSMEDIARYADRLIVMNSGEVMYNDTPKNVFAHYQELEKVGLAAPQVTYIMHDLKMKGFPVGVTATTVEEAADEIMHALGRQ